MINRVLVLQAQFATWLRQKLSSRAEIGASLVEYVLLLTLIAVAAIGALSFLGGSITNTLNHVSNQITNTTSS